MLDIQFIREHADVVKESQRKRGESVELVDEVLRSDEVRRSSLKEFEAARAQQKEIGKKVAAAPADEKAKLIAATKETLSRRSPNTRPQPTPRPREYTTAMWKLSNTVEPEAPEGGEDRLRRGQEGRARSETFAVRRLRARRTAWRAAAAWPASIWSAA